MHAEATEEMTAAEWTRRTALLVHDLRNPLLAMLGAAQLMRGRSPAETAPREAQLLDIIQSSGQHLLTLLSQLVDASASERARFPVHPRRVPLRPLLEDCLRIVEPMASHKRLVIALDADAALPASVLLDPDRIRQVVVNLLCNAVRFTDDGEVVLAVSPGRCSRTGGPTLCFEVRDTGVGIAADELLLLERCLQAASACATPAPSRREGSGLGLLSCQRVLRAIGSGTGLRLQSTPGGGTRARFVLPLR